MINFSPKFDQKNSRLPPVLDVVVVVFIVVVVLVVRLSVVLSNFHPTFRRC